MNELVTRRLPLVGRQSEKKSITRVIRGQGPPTLFLEGIAGIGKTILLEETGRIAQEQGALCPPIVDFYDTEMHAHRALEATIAWGLDPEKKAFHDYWARREQIERIPLLEKTLKEQQKELWELFLKGYTNVAEKQRVVLRFDTAELLEYERDSEEVLADCEVPPQDAPSWEWLLGRIGELENTAVLIAARPTPTGLLKRRLLEAHGGRVLPLEVKGFALEEAEAYFRATDFGKQVADEAPEMVGKIHLLSEGRPILIALALDWLERGRWERYIYPASLEGLKRWQAEAQEEERGEQHGEAWQRWDEVRRGFEIALVEQIRSLDHTGLGMAVRHAALARKGCNAKLLSRLMGVPLEEAERLVDQLLTLSFVKPPRGPRGLFFLHDEMYDLVEKYIWQVDWPDYVEQERIAEDIIGYYDGEIRRMEERIRAAETERERSGWQYQRHILLAERLYYQFDLAPQRGLAEYDHLDTQACSERAHEWDNLLRIEALRFARQRTDRAMYCGWVTIQDGKRGIADWVNMDCRVRWVHRYVARGEYEKAIEITDKLLQKYPRASKLWRARLLVSKAAAEERLGHRGGDWLYDEAEADIRETLRLLDEVELDELNEWTVNHYKATAHVYEGLVASALGELGKASEANEKASVLFRAVGYQAGEARALNNNAFILARQGKRWEALYACQKALKMRQEAGDEHGIALSLNTLGIVKGMAGDFIGALTESLKALRLSQRRRDEFGIALAHINLGWAYRHHGSSDMRKSPAEIERYFKLAEDSLLLAEENERWLEPYYHMEVHNELGCTYKDWANFLALHGAVRPRYYELMEKADAEFGIADGIAETALKLEKADNLEDWAWVYHLRYAYRDQMGEETPQALFQQAEAKLDEAEEYLQGFKEKVEPGLEWHLHLGKVYYQRAHLMKFLDKREEVARNYAFAAVYLETYSREAEELKELLFGIEGWLGQFSDDEVRNLTGIMKEVLVKKEVEGWTCGALRGWIDDVILGAPSFGLGR